MRFLRGCFLSRFLSVFFLLLFVHSIFTPYYALGLTSGPHQPEYTSYEDAGASDMVNLMTGDFTFNIPILDIPSPEGNFSLPLSYHAGIGLEQESSWTGLGFNINAGAILRNINQYPDDASGEANEVTVQDLTGVTGWNRIFNHPFRDDWNSKTGYHGNVNLLDIVEVDFGNTTSVGVVGVHVGDGGVTFDPVQFTTAAINIVSWGVGSAGTTGVTVAKQAAIDMAVNTATSFVMPSNTPGAPTAGNWQYSKSSHTTYDLSHNVWLSALTSLPIHSKKKSWKIWLDQTRTEDMYGVLYSGKMKLSSFGTMGFAGSVDDPKFYLMVNNKHTDVNFYEKYEAKGTASDINFIIDGSLPYYQQNTPTVLANDDYAVNAPGVSGSIRPYRLEVGSVSMPRDMGKNHSRFALLPYMDYKVPFVYEGSISNGYFNHVGGTTTVSSPSFYSGVDLTRVPCNGCDDFMAPLFTHSLTDIVFKEQRIRADIDNIKKVPQGNNIEWLTNEEIKSSLSTTSLVCPNKFIDFLSGLEPGIDDVTKSDYKKSDRYIFRSANALGTTNIPTQGIGGYSITAANGTTYHFALPVYDYSKKSESISVTDDKKRSILKRDSPFANTWLLTAITGPDFIDRNANGLADDGDWGYWVKMNYGKHTDTYNWRIPYKDEMVDATNTYKGYERGTKQLYYLNSIETRSHVALFMKSNREDGMSFVETTGVNPIAPLKLDEICLLKKEQYKKLSKAPYNISDYSNKISAICSSDQFAGSTVRDYINKNCVKRILFTYSYDLCKNTPNASGPNNAQKGKLTLKRISVKGRNDVQVVPDYKFEYGRNYNYSANSWDGWGMFTPTGTASATSHITNDPENGGEPSYASSWSLAKVTTPLGSELLINYERDSYTSISGESVFDADAKTYSKVNYTEPYNPDIFKTIEVSHNGYFAVGDKIRLSGEIRFKCPRNADYVNVTVSGDYTVKAVTTNSITLDRNFVNNTECLQNYNELTQVAYNSGTIRKFSKGKKGGDIRVASIVMRDENGVENKLRYLYTNDEGYSTGVIAQEPDYIKTSDLAFYNYLSYPKTPVIYSKVSVLSGKLTADSDYNSKQVFEFETPSKSLLKYTDEDKGTLTDSRSTIYRHLYKIEDRTSKIGRLNAVKIYDANGNVTSSSALVYTDQISNDAGSGYQGVFSESVLLSDITDNKYLRSNRTTTIVYPYALKKIVNSKDGFSSSSENLSWDLLTGMVTQTLDKSSLGLYVKTIKQPAYSIKAADGTLVYGELGSKAYDVNNRNMLTQGGAVYTYRSDASGNLLGLISAEAQTWKKDWSYRNYDGTIEGTQSTPVWRKGPLYVYKGDISKLNADGTHGFLEENRFKFTGTNPLWQYTGELKRFDHYGMPLEATDMNGIYSATKMGYDNRTIIASASNAKYNEIAFSSAEDKIVGQVYFGGEVGIGTGSTATVTSPVHTGSSALKIPDATATGFIFKTNELTVSKEYRASVWSNSTNARFYTRINNGSIVVSTTHTISSPVAIPGMGNWYRIDYSFQCPASVTTFEIGVKSASGAVVVDDFRFQPVDATMNCYVYPPLEFEFSSASTTYSHFTYTLDDDNLFTKYEINEKGELVKVYQESLKYGVKQVSESKSNYRRFNTNQ